MFQGLGIDEFEDAKSFRYVEGIAHRRLPGYFLPHRGWALAPEKIDAKNVSGRGQAMVERRKRNAHRSVPNLGSAINARIRLKS